MMNYDALARITEKNWSARLSAASATDARRAFIAWYQRGEIPTPLDAMSIVRAITTTRVRLPEEHVRAWAHGERIPFIVLVRELAALVDAYAGTGLGPVWASVLAAVTKAHANERDSFRL